MNFLLIGTIMLSSISAFTQHDASSRIQSSPIMKSHIERYKQDYELKDYSFTNGDSTILHQLDLESVESQRPNSGTLLVIDPNTGLEILLYSRKYQFTSINTENIEKL